MKKLLYILLFSSGLASAQSVPIKPYKTYQLDILSQDEFGSGYHLNQLFDGHADPKASLADTSGYWSTPNPFRQYPYPQGPTSGADFKGDRGMRIIFDLVGDRSIFKNARMNITDIYGLALGGDFQDTVKFYSLDTLFNVAASERWKFLSRPDSFLTPIASLVQGNAINYEPKWASVTGINKSMRYMMMSVKRKNHGGYYSVPLFAELVIYGSKLYSDASINLAPYTYTGPLPQKRRLNDVLGCTDVGLDSTVLVYDSWIRNYERVNNMDTSTAAYPFNYINADAYNSGYAYLFGQVKRGQNRGQYKWESQRGGGGQFTAVGLDAGQCIPVTIPYTEPENPFNYARLGNFAFHYASLWGFNTAHTDAEFRFVNKSSFPGYGHGFRTIYENGNEGEFRGETPLTYVLRSIVEKDSLRRGDSTMKMMMAGLVGIDTDRIKSYVWLAHMLTGDSTKVPWDYANFHHYSRTNAFMDHNPTVEELVGVHGARPEADRVYKRVTDGGNVWFREMSWWDAGGTMHTDTSKGFGISEIGYGNYATASTTPEQLNYPWTTSGIHTIPGYDSLESKGIQMCRTELILASTAMRWMNEFSITNNLYYSTNDDPTEFARNGRGGSSGGDNRLMNVKFKNYWSRASFFTRLGVYRVDTVYSIDSVGLCKVKLRSTTAPDSVCYAMWKGSYNGTDTTVTLNVGNITGNANRYDLSFSGATGATSMRSVSSGSLSVVAEEKPAFYFVEESVMPAVTQDYFIKKRGHRVIFQ